jgi:hypothetical protein
MSKNVSNESYKLSSEGCVQILRIKKREFLSSIKTCADDQILCVLRFHERSGLRQLHEPIQVMTNVIRLFEVSSELTRI